MAEWTTERMNAKLQELKAVDGGKPAAPATAAAAPVAAAAAAPKAKLAIDIDKPRYSQTNFFGRMRHFLDVIDPQTLFTSDAKLKQSLDLLAAYKAGTVTSSPSVPATTPLPAVLVPGTVVSDEHVWAAKKVRDAVIHPDTQQKVPVAVRMSAFVPVNIPIVVGMITSTSVGANVFWQWVNQSYNVAVNYANRNASSTMPTSQIAMSYAGAVVTSCSLAIGLNRFVQRAATWNPLPRTIIRSVVPYTAVASAGAVNIILMRRAEATNGISIKAKSTGETLPGTSQIAGRKGLEQATLTRVFLPLPVLAMPPLIIGAIEALVPAVKSNRRLRMPVEVGVVAASLWAGLPAAIGLFPQDCEMSVKDLEPAFRNLKDKNGQPITHVYFNKGL